MFCLAKNEALKQLLGLKRWHLSGLMLLQVSVSLMPGGATVIILLDSVWVGGDYGLSR
jgi:hypothetical protein